MRIWQCLNLIRPILIFKPYFVTSMRGWIIEQAYLPLSEVTVSISCWRVNHMTTKETKQPLRHNTVCHRKDSN